MYIYDKYSTYDIDICVSYLNAILCSYKTKFHYLPQNNWNWRKITSSKVSETQWQAACSPSHTGNLKESKTNAMPMCVTVALNTTFVKLCFKCFANKWIGIVHYSSVNEF